MGRKPETVVWKYALSEFPNCSISMPESARILCLQTQRGRPFLWVEVGIPHGISELRCFTHIGTGHGFEVPGPYVGTYQVEDGSLVWHVYERTPNGDQT